MRLWTSLAIAVLTAPLAAQASKINPDLVSIAVRPAVGSAYDRLIYLTNRNGEAVIVTSLQLTNCVNVTVACGAARNAQLRVLPDQEVMLLRVLAGRLNRPPTFKLGYTWRPERPEAGKPVVVLYDHSSAIDSVPADRTIRRDSADASAVDSIVAVPGEITVHVGATVNLGKVLKLTALDARGAAVPNITFHMAVDTGRTYARLSGGTLTGLKSGAALLLVSPPQPPSTSGLPPKGASRVRVIVLP